ncbi:MAG: flippase-like domain-containing protein [Bacteroidia bacterium]|nr:flippase-like domain-containing protein [Bacteroidia bacterium]MDW8347459.1 lysylphosphatidylglycerol synthase transmembrane domain-containing protein [Bacteroidia bacterium]
MSISAKKIIQYLIGIIIAVGMLLLAFKDIQWKEIKEGFKNANYLWIGMSMLVGIAEKFIRASRWSMLLRASGHEPKLISTFCGVAIGYLANMVLPRMGEVTRCGVVYKADNIPVAQVFGTVILERIIDVITLFLVILLALGLEHEVFYQWLVQTFQFSPAQQSKFLIFFFSVLVMGVIFLIFIAKRWNTLNSKQKWIISVKKFLEGLFEGLISIRKVKNIPLFLIYTASIWLCYTLTTYCIFLALHSTSHLGLVPALVVTLVGAVGMAAPVQGGIGIYHYVVSQSMVAYHINAEQSLVSATLNHTAQTFLVIIAGFICMIISAKLLYKKGQSANS